MHDNVERRVSTSGLRILPLGTIDQGDPSVEDTFGSGRHFDCTRRCSRCEVSSGLSAGAADCTTMDLTARLEYLLHLYSAAYDHGEADVAALREQFRKDLEPLVAQYGEEAVIDALDQLPGGQRPSVSLH